MMGVTDQQHAFSRLWRLRGLAGLELMRARYLSHVFARHGHETFAVGVVQDGHEEIWFRGGTERAGPGGLVFINPEEVHTGVAVTDRGWAYRVLYPPTTLMAELAGVRGTPSFGRKVVYDARFAELLVTAHRATQTADALTAQTAILSVLAQLLRRYGAAVGSQRSPGGLAARVRDILRERLVDPPSLTELAAQVGGRPFPVLRSFRDAYGLPPHAFVTQLRVREACRLLAAGLPAVEVAPAVGFFDQAHLSRHFRRLVGVPPGAYQRAVQDRTSIPGRTAPNLTGRTETTATAQDGAGKGKRQ